VANVWSVLSEKGWETVREYSSAARSGELFRDSTYVKIAQIARDGKNGKKTL